MSTSSKTGHKVLGVMSAERAEKLLLDWANLPDLAGGLKAKEVLHRMKRYPEIVGGFELGEGKTAELLQLLLTIGNYLREAWHAPDSRHRDWYLFRLRDAYNRHFVMHGGGEDAPKIAPRPYFAAAFTEKADMVPAVTAFEAAIFYLQDTVRERAKRCGNVDCPAPYFIAEKRWQKYCTEKCAAPATREAKRQWWRDKRAKKGGVQ